MKVKRGLNSVLTMQSPPSRTPKVVLWEVLSKYMTQTDDNSPKAANDVPEIAINLLISGWLLLFGVRSLVITPLVWSNLITPDQIASLDPILLKIYLILFSLTLLVAALRAVRQAQRKPQTDPAPSLESET